MSIYESLNVRPIINATGTFTRLSGTLMAPEVVAAMGEAAKQFVCIEDLQLQAGKVIAELTGAEAGYVTSGAQAGLVLSIAACITGLDPAKMDRLPRTEGMANEVVMARVHRNSYDHAVETAGGVIVEVGKPDSVTATDYMAAIGENTAAILFLPWDVGGITLSDVCAVANEHGVPVVVDGAGRLDVSDNLRAFIAAGADLAVFSGGKFIRGPQASGFVCGRKELISAIAWQHLDMDVTPRVWTAPRELVDVEAMPFIPRQGIGRGYKAGKEEIVGLITALRMFVTRDQAAERKRMEYELHSLVDGLVDVRGVQAEFMPVGTFHRGLPLARVRIEPETIGQDIYAFMLALKQGDPSIHASERELEQNAVVVNPFGLVAGDGKRIADRVRAIVAPSGGV